MNASVSLRCLSPSSRWRANALSEFIREEPKPITADLLGKLSKFYENLPPEQAYALMKRFEFHYTPKKGSWLNMAELELSALSRQCLSRRIPDIGTLSGELESIVKERNELEIKVKWQFTIESAREKLNRHYENVILKT